MEAEPTVFVIDHDAESRAAIISLAKSVGLPCIEFERAEEFLAGYDQQRSGCVVVELRLLGMGGLELLEELSDQRPRPPVIILTAHGDVGTAARAFKAGAFDFLEKPLVPPVMLDALRRAIQADQEARRTDAETNDIKRRLARLTVRERQVLDLIIAGHTTKSISVILNLSPKTVDFHRAKMMDKLQANTVADVVRMALAAGKAS